MEIETLNEIAGQVDVEYYNLKGEELHLKLPPGDLIKICNVLHDYVDLLRYYEAEYENDISRAVSVMVYGVYADRLKKIQEKIESSLGYSTEQAIKKCRKKALKKSRDKDIGEDALVLASRARATNQKKEQEQEKEVMKVEKKIETNQMNLFDLLK